MEPEAAMSSVFNLGINLASSALAFLFGISLRSMLHYLRTYRSRRFWGPGVRKGKTVLCLGSFKASDLGPYMKVEDFEPTGLAGLGDSKALHELTAMLSKMGIYIYSYVILGFASFRGDQEQPSIVGGRSS